MSVRRATWYDAVNLISWLLAGSEKNALDPSMLRWTPETLKVFVSEKNDEPVVMAPCHTSVTIESLAIRPDATPEEKQGAVIEAVNAIAFEAASNGVKQLNYISSDEKTDERAMKHLGFSKCVCYVKKL